ncbi:ClpV1 family T6SS ATPase [Photobacterium jeanii]|uniref:ClpV1 family T6SS ATPase n=1 Tax=Photobacterium jeanii TaxID=858640 RepID=A0A178KL30_9GAMM|nr:type VI secretion system ATPase TssH [Photobacterium jeanii]OAN17826.1 ClpV1 family T6SS ATPase [Photobacterium jeanii]PST92508.1 type VI secretion system ATPase TssH [Photobacterium jeanii]
MINVELQSLVKRLTPTLKSALEMAAGDCMARTHFSIESEHWFYQLLNETTSGWKALIQQGNVDHEQIIQGLTRYFNGLSRGNDSAPALSPSLVELLKDCWLLASLNQNNGSINGYHVLMVLKQRIDQGGYNGELAPWLNTVSLESLKQLAAKNKETLRQATSHSDVQPVDGEVSTVALDKYTHNLTEAARNGKLAPISGRNTEIRKSIDILCRRRQNSPILVGDPGVGKTAIVEGLAQQIVDGNVPPSLADVELRTLDLSLLQAGASIKGEFENRLKDVLAEVKQSPRPIIVFIDEAHTLIGAGGAAGQNDAANLLKPALARGEFRTIAATTWAEYKQYFETDAALTRRFQLVGVGEPNETDAIQMLRGVAKGLQKHHKVTILEEALEAAVKLSVRFLPERQLPDKAISLLDTACSRIGLSQSALPQQLDNLAEQIRYAKNEKTSFEHEHAMLANGADKLAAIEVTIAKLEAEYAELDGRWSAEKALVDQIVELQSTITERFRAGEVVADSQEQQALAALMNELSELQGEAPLVIPQVDKQTIAEVISLWTGIPVGNMVKDEVARLLNIEAEIGKRVIGQRAPIEEISKAIRMSRAGLTDPRKPIGVFLMCGPSGVGKTETALALTDLLYGGEKNITTINMTEFKEEHKISMLLGSPAGYVGYGKGGVLTEAVRKNPYSVLLLDEMEKAHPGVHDLFYQIFDKGSISDSEGREIDFKNTIIIMTSNAADSAVVDACADDRPSVPELTETIFPALQNYFKPAFLGRTTVVPYFPLNNDEMAQIARLSLGRIEKRVRSHYGASFSYSDALIEHLIAQNHSPETGARAIEQIINRTLMPELASQCIVRLSEGLSIQHVEVCAENGAVSISIE